MPAKLSYINARGTEIVLDDDERSFLGELQGREGFEAPEIELSSVQYGNGTEETISAKLKPREATCYFWAETLDWKRFDRKFSDLKAALIQVGAKPKSWGRLRIRKRSGGYVYLNCLYSEGLDSMVRDSETRAAFHLTFKASDPLFYDGYEQRVELRTWEEGAWLHFGTRFTFGQHTHFRSSDTIHGETVEMECFRAYPVITITGPARNIMLRNLTTEQVIALEPEFELLEGETFEIRTDPLTRSAVWHRFDGTERNGSKFLTAESHLEWFLCHGVNELQYRNSDTNEVSVCTLRYQQGWLSVE